MAKKAIIRKKKQGLQKRAMQTREAILMAAIRLLEREGMAAFNTNRIAELTGISVGSLYQYFSNKESILEELVRNSINQRVNFVKELLQKNSQHLTPLEAVDALIESAMQTPETLPEVDQILFELNHLILRNEKIKSVDEYLLPLMKDYLKKYFPKASKNNVDLILMVVMNATRGVIGVAQAEGFKRHSKKEIKAELSHLVFRYLENV